VKVVVVDAKRGIGHDGWDGGTLLARKRKKKRKRRRRRRRREGIPFSFPPQ